LWAQIEYWKQITFRQKEVENPYYALYHANPTRIKYIFPYFETYDHTITQNWEKTKGIQDFTIAEKIINLAGLWGKLTKQASGTSVNQPQMWSGPGAVSYNVNFTLFNTLNTNENKHIEKNYELRHRLLMATLHNQQTLILATPPALFTVEIPGIRASPVAVISQLTVNNIGQINQMPVQVTNFSNSQSQLETKLINVPDAWEFNIQITELISESRQILQASNNGSLDPVRAIMEGDRQAPRNR
jgi:hypothetical protein